MCVEFYCIIPCVTLLIKIVRAIYYNLNSDETYLLEYVCNELEQPNDMLMICVGIWYSALESIDSVEGVQCFHKQNREILKLFIERNDLVDIWRIFDLCSMTTYNYYQEEEMC